MKENGEPESNKQETVLPDTSILTVKLDALELRVPPTLNSAARFLMTDTLIRRAFLRKKRM